jgi:hypothetical protein
MLNLREYRSRADRLADHLPWAALVAPGIVLNKDGSFQRTLAFRGPDLESATEAELVSACARANNVLKRFGSGWALFFEAERREALGYPDSAFPDAASWLVDRGAARRFLRGGGHAFREPLSSDPDLPAAADQADSRPRAGRACRRRRAATGARRWPASSPRPIARSTCSRGFMPEVAGARRCRDADLPPRHDLDARHPVACPRRRCISTALLADTPLTGGLEPMLGRCTCGR